MADTKISAMSSAGTLTDSDVLALINASTSDKVTLDTLTTYFESRGRLGNGSVAQQGGGFATDTYMLGSNIAVPDGRLKATTMYRFQATMTKTAASTGTIVTALRLGTTGTTSD